MSDSFGSRLRQRREEQQIALATIAECTKIKQSLLEAMERDDVSHWPTGIFRRAFIRAYAQAINLDPDVVVREFVEQHPDPSVSTISPEALAAALDAGRGSSASPTRLRSMLGSAIGSWAQRRRSPDDGVVVPKIELPLDSIELTSPVGGADPVFGLPQVQTAVVQAPEVAEPVQASLDPDFSAVASLCTKLARVEEMQEIRPLLAASASVLHAAGLVVWMWDASASELRPVLAHGYSDRVLAQLPNLPRDADNVTAVAFRSGETCAIHSVDGGNGALAIPLATPSGSSGVLAIEFRNSVASPLVHAAATIIAAQLAQLTGGVSSAESEEPRVDFVEAFAAPLLRASAC